jgi:hypothetical protein
MGFARRHKEPTITPLAAYPQAVAYHDCVRVLDGRIGVVIGFYRRKDESMLVRFPSGESHEFPASETRATLLGPLCERAGEASACRSLGSHCRGGPAG